MSNSKEVINPKFPRNIDDLVREGDADQKLERGVLVVRSGQRSISLCDPDGTPAHIAAPVEVQWIDGINRHDVEYVKPDGTTKYQHTCLGDDLVADVISDDTLFDGDTPQENDVVIKSLALSTDTTEVINPGKMRALSAAEVAAEITAGTFTSEEFQGLRVGEVEGASERPGMVRVNFDLS